MTWNDLILRAIPVVLKRKTPTLSRKYSHRFFCWTGCLKVVLGGYHRIFSGVKVNTQHSILRRLATSSGECTGFPTLGEQISIEIRYPSLYLVVVYIILFYDEMICQCHYIICHIPTWHNGTVMYSHEIIHYFKQQLTDFCLVGHMQPFLRCHIHCSVVWFYVILKYKNHFSGNLIAIWFFSETLKLGIHIITRISKFHSLK